MTIDPEGNNLFQEINNQMFSDRKRITQMQEQINTNKQMRVEILEGATLSKNGCTLTYDGVCYLNVSVNGECIRDDISDWHEAMELFSKNANSW